MHFALRRWYANGGAQHRRQSCQGGLIINKTQRNSCKFRKSSVVIKLNLLELVPARYYTRNTFIKTNTRAKQVSTMKKADPYQEFSARRAIKLSACGFVDAPRPTADRPTPAGQKSSPFSRAPGKTPLSRDRAHFRQAHCARLVLRSLRSPGDAAMAAPMCQPAPDSPSRSASRLPSMSASRFVRLRFPSIFTPNPPDPCSPLALIP